MRPRRNPAGPEGTPDTPAQPVDAWDRLFAYLESHEQVTLPVFHDLLGTVSPTTFPTWLHHLPQEDQVLAMVELRRSLIKLSTALREGTSVSLEEVALTIREWRTTATQLQDPVRAEVLLAPGYDPQDFTGAPRPE